jgi:predicted Zn-dependent peptidase
VTQQITHRRLSNGLSILVEPMEGVRSAAFTLLVPAGAIHDPGARLGAANVLCDMVLRGAGKRDSRQLVAALDNLGVERSEGVGSTHTSFSGATIASNLPGALEIYADVLRRAHLPEDQLEYSRSLALQELAGIEDEPRQKVMLELRRRHYEQPWGRPTIGTADGLKAIRQEDLVGQYAERYCANGTILAVAGSVEPESVLNAAEELFGDWDAGVEAEIVEGPSGPKIDHIAHETSQTQIGIAYASVPYGAADYYRAYGAVGVLSGGMSARLFTEVREKRGLCYAVYAAHHTLLGRAAVMCYAGTSAERAQETLDVTLGELRRLEEGIAEEELSRVKARMKSSLIMQQESTSARSASIARDWYYLGRVTTLEEVQHEIDSLSCEGIVEHLHRFPVRDITVVTLGPRPLEVR